MTWRLIQASLSFLLLLQLLLLLLPLYKNTKYKYYYILYIIIHTLFSSLSLSNSNNGLCWILTGQTRRSALSLSLSLPTDLISFFPFQHFTFLPTNSLQGKPKTKFVFGCCSLSKIFDFVYNYLFFYFSRFIYFFNL